MQDFINSGVWTGYPPGAVRFRRATTRKPRWYVRLWNRITRRPTVYDVTYTFEARGRS